MENQPMQTITCPRCSNINPTIVDQCVKCGLDLSMIKGLLAGTGPLQPIPPVEVNLRKQAPPVPILPSIGKDDLGKYIEGRLLLIRGMASRKADMIGFFFTQLHQHSIPEIEASQGDLEIDKKRRFYYFIQRYLEEKKKRSVLKKMFTGQAVIGPLAKSDDEVRARATMAIAIFEAGNDLMVEWRNYVRTSVTWAGTVATLGAAVATYGTSLLSKEGRDSRDASTLGFQDQDNLVLQLGVRAALEEAVDQCQISHNIIQSIGGRSNDQRLI